MKNKNHYSWITNKLKNKTIELSYCYCGLCGRTPDSNEEPNYAPIRWWDCDDGWKITSLCSDCIGETFGVQPKPSDFAFKLTNGVCDVEETDEDISLVF